MDSLHYDTVRPLQWTSTGLQVLDQRLLPESLVYEMCSSAAEVAEAIRSMRVRGAPAIGIAAAYGIVLAARTRFRQDPANWQSLIDQDYKLLACSRPTAVNLFWALQQMRQVPISSGSDPEPALLEAARRIHADDIAANRRIGELGAAIIADASGVLTHCNTGSLATGGFGTALGVMRSAHANGLQNIYATETRPWRQGARLTVWELAQDGIPATLIADSAAAYLMKSSAVQWVIVGADRIAANGDTANKIGTYSLAVLAKAHGVKFMVAAPTSTLDWQTPAGDLIEIEQRAWQELLPECFMQAESVIRAWNPVFDVTPAELIDAIVTEQGVVLNPAINGLAALKPS